MRNETRVWPEVGDAGTSGAGAVPLRSGQIMEQQKKKKKDANTNIMVKIIGIIILLILRLPFPHSGSSDLLHQVLVSCPRGSFDFKEGIKVKGSRDRRIFKTIRRSFFLSA